MIAPTSPHALAPFALLVLLGTSMQDGQRHPVEPEAAASAVQEFAPDTRLQIYEVARFTGQVRLDRLLDALSDASGSLDATAARGHLEKLAHERAQVALTTDSLVTMLRERIEPPLEDELCLAELDGGRIALLGSGVQHGWITDFLAAAREFRGLFDVQARISLLERGQLEQLSQERSGAVLSPAAAERLLGDLAAAGVETVTAPRVLTHPFQAARLSVVDQVAFIQDYELKVLPDGVEIADPVIGVVDSGIVMHIRGIPQAHGKLGIYANLEYSTLEEPIPSVTTTLGAAGHEVTVQVPQVTKVLVEGHFELASGETLMMASVDPVGEKEVLVLMRASRVEAVEEAGPR